MAAEEETSMSAVQEGGCNASALGGWEERGAGSTRAQSGCPHCNTKACLSME